MTAVLVVLGLVAVGLAAALAVSLGTRRRVAGATALEALVREVTGQRATDERAATAAALEQLVVMNTEMMEAQRRLGAEEMAGTQGRISHEIVEMRGELGKLASLLHAVERERREHVGKLTTQLEEAGRHTRVLAETTHSLREALSSTTARGQWGERMAEDVLRLAGLVEHVNYRKRHAIAGSGRIPDYTFLLPQGLCLHMDVKFPLNNYMRFLDADSDVERERYRREFLKDVRLRLKEVTSRDYVDAGANTVDCVLLFIPNEQVYGFIQEHDRSLLDDALRDKVVFCSPLTLFAVLAVIRQAVDNFRLSQTSQEILGLLQGFQRQWERFVEQMDKVGRSLKSADTAFEELEGTRRRQLERELDKIDVARARQSLDAVADGGDAPLRPLALEA